MKRFLALALALIMTFSLAGCKFTGIKAKIKADLENSLDAIISGQPIDTVYATTIPGNELPSYTLKEDISTKIRQNAEYKINDIRPSGDTAQADVTITAPDFYSMVMDLYNESEDDIPDRFLEWLDDGGYPKKDTDVVIDLIQNKDDGTYRPEESEEVNDAVDGGANSSKEDIAEIGGIGNELYDKAKILNNGGSAVEYKGNLYYFATTYVDSYAPHLTKQTLFLRKDDGTERSLGINSLFRPEIYISNDKLYVTETVEQGTYVLREMTLEGEVISSFDDTFVCAIDESGSDLVLENTMESYYSIYNTETSSEIRLDIQTGLTDFLFANNGTAYYYGTESSPDYPRFFFYSCNLETGVSKELCTFNWEATDSGITPDYIAPDCYQETEDYIYILYGYYAGSAAMYQEGIVARYNKSNGMTETLCNFNPGPSGIEPSLYVFEKDGVDMVLYYNRENYLYNTKTKESIVTSKLAGNLGKPISEYVDESVRYWCYPETDGKIIEILPEISLNTEADETRITNVEYTGTYTVYTMYYYKLNPDSYSWRDSTLPYKAFTYLHNIEGGETVLLCTSDGSTTQESAEPATTAPAETTDNAAWKNLYVDYADTVSDYYPNAYIFYLDNDNVPELYLMGESHISGAKLCWIENDEVKEKIVGQTFGYKEKTGKCFTRTTQSGVTLFTEHTLKNENLTSTILGNGSTMIDKFDWNGATMGEEEFWDNLNNYTSSFTIPDISSYAKTTNLNSALAIY